MYVVPKERVSRGEVSAKGSLGKFVPVAADAVSEMDNILKVVPLYRFVTVN